MAGSLYLGSQKVCPVIVGGGSGINAGLDVDQDGKLISQQTGSVVFSGFNDVGDYAFFTWFYGSSITSVDLSNLTAISGNQSCYNMFRNCVSLTYADLSNLTTISGYRSCEEMFAGCTSLTSADLNNLETISGTNGCSGMFAGCTSLTSLSFPSLKTISDTYAFAGLIYGCSGVTIHFPSNMESTISDLSGYPNFGGTNTTILYDLPATE